jgi:NADPH:quinone reductase-like Zn-dependent oxidoreductase
VSLVLSIYGNQSRDNLVIQGTYPWKVKPNVVPGSDGAGIVLKIGKNVTRFQPGDQVITMLNQQHLGGSLDPKTMRYGLGASVDGTLRTVGAFDEQGLVAMPQGLSFTEAATLTCAGLTAWNALFGLQGRPLMAGQWVLALGTGGVSIFAIQFAKAVGAKVIATTSSNEKSKMLREILGVDHVINYRKTPDWGVKAKSLTGGAGVDLVVEVAGPSSLKQSVQSVKMDGIISVLGFVGGMESKEPLPSILECWMSLFTARGIWVGSRLQLEDMCRAIEGNPQKLRPVVDKVFKLEELKDALGYLASGNHQGKVCIEVP